MSDTRVCVTAENLLDCLLAEYVYWRDNECSGSIGATGAISNVIAFATVPRFRAEWHPEKMHKTQRRERRHADGRAV